MNDEAACLGSVNRFDAARPVDLMDNTAVLPTTPQAPQPPQKRSIHLVPKPVNSGWW
jgi:hypothetical protein